MSPPLLPELGIFAIHHLISELDSSETHQLRDAPLLRMLCKCTLVCRDWRRRCRAHLFRTVYIEDTRRIDILTQTFQETPSLRDSVEFVQAKIQLDVHSSGGVSLHTVLLFVRQTLPRASGLRLLPNLNSPHLSFNRITRTCLSMGYASIDELCLEGISPSRVGHLTYALPSLTSLKCRDIENHDGRPILLPSRLRLSKIDVRDPHLYFQHDDSTTIKPSGARFLRRYFFKDDH